MTIPEDSAVLCVVNIWVAGASGLGKSRFIQWYIKHVLNLMVYCPPMSENFKWWNYINQKVIRIEEMDQSCKISVGRMKMLCDVQPIMLGKKKICPSRVRKVSKMFVAGYNAMVARNSSRCSEVTIFIFVLSRIFFRTTVSLENRRWF